MRESPDHSCVESDCESPRGAGERTVAEANGTSAVARAHPAPATRVKGIRGHVQRWLAGYRLHILAAFLRSPGSLFDQHFECPICAYRGPFITLKARIEPRRHARCPRCGSLERHRLQYLVACEALSRRDAAAMDALHFAPEPFFRRIFGGWFRSYTTADLDAGDVEHQADLRCLPFADDTFDFIFAAHVLEHVDEDTKALAEIARVLRPNGIAILPVPIVAPRTVEYPHPIPTEHNHVRAPGWDYFDRYRPYFKDVLVRTSAEFDQKYQTWIYESRSRFPTARCPYRPPMTGERHLDAVPICCG